tara:strand:+ start:717 stop:1085 length:369 start_codon:yes stop_codon:yes gene_type:complete
MRVLFDEHISFRLVRSLHDIFPEAKHVKYFNLENEDDERIWYFAKKEAFTIITKDDDFHQRSITFGAPPKVIWLKVGNTNRSELEQFIRSKSIEIRRFIEEDPESLLILTKAESGSQGESNP